ncbi:hypothetical protein AB6D11_18600 [Vibrio splendidus]
MSLSLDKRELYAFAQARLTQEFGPLPMHGVIAGQSVTSAIFECLGIMDAPPYKDLDVFVTKEEREALGVSEQALLYPDRTSRNGLLKSKSDTGHGAFTGSYEVSIASIDRGSYTIINSLNVPWNPRINLTEYLSTKAPFSGNIINDDNPVGYPEPGTHLSVIEGFDINACQAALDHEKQEVVMSEAFVNFLFQRELDVTYYATPMHTSIRLLKKRDQLPFATVNIPKVMRKLQTACLVGEAIIEYRQNTTATPYLPGNLFSDVYQQRYEQYADELAPYFTHKYLEVSFEDRVRPKKPVPDEFGVLDLVSLSNYNPNHCVTEKSTRQFMVLSPKGGCEKTMKDMDAWVPMGKTTNYETSVQIMDKIYEWHNSKDNVKQQRISEHFRQSMEGQAQGLSQLYLLMNVLSETSDFTMLGHTKGALSRVVKLYNKHPLLLSSIKAESPVNRMLELVKPLRWLERHKMEYVIGFIEKLGFDPSPHKRGEPLFPEALTQDFFLSPDFTERVKIADTAYRLALAANNVRATWEAVLARFLSDRPNVTIKEITNQGQVMAEGDSMRHCIGGYWPSIERADMDAFHLTLARDGEVEHATLALQLVKRNMLKVDSIDKDWLSRIELQGPSNTPVSKAMNDLCNELMQACERYTIGRVSSAKALLKAWGNDKRPDVHKIEEVVYRLATHGRFKENDMKRHEVLMESAIQKDRYRPLQESVVNLIEF